MRKYKYENKSIEYSLNKSKNVTSTNVGAGAKSVTQTAERQIGSRAQSHLQRADLEQFTAACEGIDVVVHLRRIYRATQTAPDQETARDGHEKLHWAVEAGVHMSRMITPSDQMRKLDQQEIRERTTEDKRNDQAIAPAEFEMKIQLDFKELFATDSDGFTATCPVSH